MTPEKKEELIGKLKRIARNEIRTTRFKPRAPLAVSASRLGGKPAVPSDFVWPQYTFKFSEYKGKKLGTIGDCASFSFFSNKNISTGEGGMFITNNEEMAQKARLIRSHGMSTMSYQRASGHATEYDITCLGYNFRMDDIRAAIAIEQLKKLPGDLQTRIKMREQYIDKLIGVEGIAIPFADNSEFVSNYIFPVVLLNSTKERRNNIRNYMHAAGIQTSVHYPAVHKFSTYKELGAVLPQTEYVTNNEITLPMYAALTTEQIDFICVTFKQALKEC